MCGNPEQAAGGTGSHSMSRRSRHNARPTCRAMLLIGGAKCRSIPDSRRRESAGQPRPVLAGRYPLLRATIERVIQDVVFNGVVKRYRDWIRIDKLGGVVGCTEDEFKEIDRLHKACCDVVDAHDHPSVKNASIPSSTQLGKDVADLKAVADAINQRRKKGGSVVVTVV